MDLSHQEIVQYLQKGLMLCLLLAGLNYGMSFAPAASQAPLTIIIGLLIYSSHKNKALSLFLAYIIASYYRNVIQGTIFFIEFNSTVMTTAATRMANYFFLLGAVLFLFKEFHKLKLNLPLLGGILSFCFVFLLACLSSTSFSHSFVELLRLTQFLGLFFILVSLMRTRQDFYLVFFSAASSFIVLAILLIGRIISDPGRHGATLKFVIFIAFFQTLILYTKKKNYRKLSRNLLLFTLVTSLLMMFGVSRRLLFAIMFMWALFMLVYGIKLNIVIIAVIGLTILINFIPQGLFYRTQATLEYVAANYRGERTQRTLSDITSTRSKLWSLGLKIFNENPVLGVGPGVSEQMLPDMLIGYTKVKRIHNLYLELLADIGVIGFTGYLIYLLSVYLLIQKGKKLARLRRDTFFEYFFLMCQNAFLAYLFINIFGYSGITEKYEWFINAVIVAAYLLLRKYPTFTNPPAKLQTVPL